VSSHASGGQQFRITEENLGSWIAVVISSALFGLAPIGNPDATWISTTAIALEARVLLAAAYMWTRRLWFAIGIHFSWNVTQGGSLGVTGSGKQVDGLLSGRLSEP
jgi:CAAX protease family protein